jgi:glycosyltransferase involved in cell wall biosynthesis
MKLAFCIPAYNNPEYLYKCLKSLINQKNKSFDVLISDDCSPLDLFQVVEKIKKECNGSISIDYFKQKINLGIYWNTREVFDRSNHDYKVLLQHDDEIEDAFYSNKILEAFERNDRCSAVIFNAVTEHTNRKSFEYQGNNIFNGKDFLADHLFKDIHPSYSSVALNTKLLDKKAYLSTYVNRADANRMKVEIDECFQILSMVLLEGQAYVSGEVATIRGEPSTSATQRNELPYKTAAQGMLIAYYQLYKHMKIRNHKKCADEMERLLIYVFPSPRINFKIIKYFNYEIKFIKFHILGCLYRNYLRIIRILNARK